jgi:hypothetical protein
MRSLSIVVMSQIKLIPTPSWLVYFVLKAQPFFINFEYRGNLLQYFNPRIRRVKITLLIYRIIVFFWFMRVLDLDSQY